MRHKMKEILMVMNMRSLPPKPPFQEEEKEKGSAETDASKEADAVVFVSSIQIAEEEEV